MAEAAKPEVNQKSYKITEIIKETPEVTIFRFMSEDNQRVSFSPGMFMMITYGNPQATDKITRAFSLASVPDSDTLEFYVSMIHGRFTSKLEAAKVGDEYYMTGPYGQFKFDKEKDTKVVFIAGGTGLAPFMSMLRQIEEQKLSTDVCLIYSVKYPTEIIRKGELEQFKTNIGMKSFITVTRPAAGDGWTGPTGHIDAAMLNKYIPDAKERTAYICGPLGFVKALKEALAGVGCPEQNVKADVWG